MAETALIGLAIFVGMLALIMLGFPIYVSMLTGTLVGFLVLGTPSMLLIQFTNGPFTRCVSYTYAVVPLFTIVGTLAGNTGIAQGAYSSIKKWVGGIRGGLLYTTILANAAFGACSGSSTAGNVVFSKIAIPELDRADYDKELSMGCVASAGILSALIPPSVGIIMFCLITGVSIGTSLICGIGGAILFIILQFACIFIISKVRPEKVPFPSEEDKHIPLKEKILGLRLLVPIVLLFAVIIGGCMLGWFPATVAGAFAAVILIVYAIIKQLPLKTIWSCVWEGAQVFGSIYLVIICGQMFSRVIAMSGLADYLAGLIINMNVPAYLIYVICIVFYLFCGCFMEMMSIIVITVPIVFPVLTGLGYNPFLLVIALVFVMDMAQLTPPVGLGVYTVANVIGENPMRIFRGVVPFFVTEIIAVLLIGLVPDLVLWFPKVLGVI